MPRQLFTSVTNLVSELLRQGTVVGSSGRADGDAGERERVDRVGSVVLVRDLTSDRLIHLESSGCHHPQ